MKQVKVKALVRAKDNGVTHEPGEVFEMEASLVGPHEKAGQVERAEPAVAGGRAGKQPGPRAD